MEININLYSLLKWAAVAVLVVAYLDTMHRWEHVLKPSPAEATTVEGGFSMVAMEVSAPTWAEVIAGKTASAATPAKAAKSKAAAKRRKPATAKLKATGARAAYILRYQDTALEEMKLYGIPASVKMAQGILESKAGASGLALKANNHFGIKCHSTRCKKGHCVNNADDSHKDFFLKHDSAWESWRAHSKLLQGDRYAHLPGQCGNDYKCWARGLKKAGYATAPGYAASVIGIIEAHRLDVLDSGVRFVE